MKSSHLSRITFQTKDAINKLPEIGCCPRGGMTFAGDKLPRKHRVKLQKTNTVGHLEHRPLQTP